MKRRGNHDTLLLERSTEPPVAIRFETRADGTVRFSCVGRDVHSGRQVVVLAELDRVVEAIRLKRIMQREAADDS